MLYVLSGQAATISANSSVTIVKPMAWKDHTDWAKCRNNKLTAIKLLGRAIWKRWSGYHQRNLVETAIHRFKRLGERLQACKLAQQAAEVYVRCAILNRWKHLGMPVTVPCA